MERPVQGNPRPTAHRRDILKAGLAVSALPAALAAQPALALTSAPTLSLYKVIYDRDDAHASAFGRAAAAAGQSTVGVGGDLTELWYDLQRRWKDGPAAIAGLTNPATAMVLEMMAWDVGMRTFYRAEHRPTADGRVRHDLCAPQAILARASLLDTGAGWSLGASRLVGACPAERGEKAALVVETLVPSAARTEPLVSWVVAPVRRT